MLLSFEQKSSNTKKLPQIIGVSAVLFMLSCKGGADKKVAADPPSVTERPDTGVTVK